MARSLNRVQLIGNLTRDPELRYTPSGAAVCSFSIATNRVWKTEAGEKKEEVDFHRIVAWNKLAELCGQFLVKGRKVYVEGRLSTRNWTAADGAQKTTTEVIISDMILLDNKKQESSDAVPIPTSAEQVPTSKEAKPIKKKPEEKDLNSDKQKETGEQASSEEAVAPDDIPF